MPIEYRLCRYRGKFAVQWHDDDGRHRVTLGTDSRAEADRLFADFLRGKEVAGRPDAITVAFAWDGYRKSLGDKPAATTMGFEWRAIGPRLGDRGAATITEADCMTYIAARRRQGRADGTIWTELGRLRSALKWAESKNLIDRAPKIFRPERPPPRDDRLTREQIGIFLAHCTFPHIKMFVTLAVTTGARMSAILQLTWDRVDFDRSTIVYHDPERARTKKGRATVPMNDMARAALLEAKRGAVTPYVVEWAGSRVVSIKKGLASVGKRCGLPWVTAHVFRHSAATAMAERGVPMAEIAQFLGHADSRVTERVYARFSPTYLRRAADALEFA
jgi:integrase